MKFYGNRVGAEAAAYGYACAINRIDWMAGSRALPQDGHVTWNHGPIVNDFGKHRGKRFSDVLSEDPDYLTWAKEQEAKLRNLGGKFNRDGGNLGMTARSDSIEQFVEYALSKDCPANFDIAYEEEMSSVLLKQAEEGVKKDESLALALNFSAQQKKVLEQCKVKPTI